MCVFRFFFLIILKYMYRQRVLLCIPCLGLILASRKLFPDTARACKDFHIKRNLRISVTCVHKTRAFSPLSWDSTHVAMSLARAIMFHMNHSPPLAARRRKSSILIIANIATTMNDDIFPRFFKIAIFCYISDRSPTRPRSNLDIHRTWER